MSNVGSVILLDAADDRWLLDRVDDRLGIRALVPAAEAEREFGYVETSLGPLLSKDGRTLVSCGSGTGLRSACRLMVCWCWRCCSRRGSCDCTRLEQAIP